MENDDEHVGVAGLPKKWIWNFRVDASRMSMGIIRMPQNDPMMARPHGNPLLSLGEMAEWNREATVRPGGLIEWRMMGHTMVPLAQAAISGLSHDSMASTRMPGMPRLHRMLQSRRRRPSGNGPATVLSEVANALNPGAEVVLRMNANAKAK